MLWWHRWRARSLINARVGLWYHRDYAAPDIPFDRRVAHMQTDRAEMALARLVRQGLITPDDVAVPPLARLEDLERVHPRTYLEQVTFREVLGRVFGLVPELVEVDALLTAQRRAVGGTIAAALAATRGQVRVAVNLGGGFHHAAPERGAGFCVYNDVAVAIARLRARGYRAPVAIVDLDFHQGDGNLAAFLDDPSVLVFSLHGGVWTQQRSPACVNVELPSGTTDRQYLATLDEHLFKALRAHRTGLVFYVAGVDVLGGDQLGDFRLTHRGVLRRDLRVIAAAEALGAPVVVTMAGGYSPGAWQCTANLVRSLLTGVRRVDRAPEERLRSRFEQVARQIEPWQLQSEGLELRFEESDLLPDAGRRPSLLILDYYTASGLELALERYGLLAKLRGRGFGELAVSVRADDPSNQIIRVHGRPLGKVAEPVLLVELVLGRGVIAPPRGAESGRPPLPVLRVEWLLLQDPTRTFSATRTRLPGQEHPGLGVAHDVQQLLVQVCKRLGLEGCVHRPAHYHNAVVAARDFSFYSPLTAGLFHAMRRVLANVTLAEATHLVERGRLVLADGEGVAWKPSDLVLPVGDVLLKYFHSKYYSEKTAAETERLLAAGLRVGEDPR